MSGSSSEPGAPPAGGRSHAESEFRGLASTRVLPCTSVVEAASLGSARRRIAAHSSALSALWAMKARGAELSFLSAFPGEQEVLYPPLTYMRPTGKVSTHRLGRGDVRIVEVVPHFPSGA